MMVSVCVPVGSNGAHPPLDDRLPHLSHLLNDSGVTSERFGLL